MKWRLAGAVGGKAGSGRDEREFWDALLDLWCLDESLERRGARVDTKGVVGAGEEGGKDQLAGR